jgi:transcriptional regulator with XRE-family HTH domain
MKNEPKKKGILSTEELRKLRTSRRESQTKFWGRFGVTQSRGSRFELGLEMPRPITILLKLYLDGAISDSDLRRARQRQKLEEKSPQGDQP